MRIRGSTRGGRLVPLISLLLLFAFLSVGASVAAQDHVRVLANLPLEGMHVNRMFVQQVGNKTYLYLHRQRKDVFALVDVSKPDKPVLVSRRALKGSSEGPAAGSAFAITVAPEAMDPGAKLPMETVNLVDASHPKAIKTIKTFTGVTSMYNDDARKLVYLVNGEGLWIVSHRLTRPVSICGTEEESDCLAGP